MPSILLNPEAVAQRWNMNTQTLSQWRWNGRGPLYLKIGRRIFYRLEDISEFEEQRRCQNTTLQKNIGK